MVRECGSCSFLWRGVVKRLKLAMPMRSLRVCCIAWAISTFLCNWRGKRLSQPRVTLSKGLVDEWHPAIAKAVLKNWHVNDAVCDAVGMQADGPCGAVGTSNH